jgi:amidase
MTSAAPFLGRLTRNGAGSDVSAESTLRGLLERIATVETRVRAWEYLDRDRALTAARELDRRTAAGPLHGVPFGVKDIFETYDMPTQFGSPIYRGHQPRSDAACVATARKLGALILGKTTTTEFATFPPSNTTNPHDATRTPGGSSSGSAAAVASGMVPVAFGTQTTGSIIRPAAFCGCVGYKPSFGTLPRIGIKAITESFDTVGVFARNVDDAAFSVAALAGRDELCVADAVPVPKIGVCFTAQWPAAQQETQALFERLPRELERAGAKVTELRLPREYDTLNEAQDTIWQYEMARCLADEHRRFADQLAPRLRGQLESGWATPYFQYAAAMEQARLAREHFAAATGDVDILITPSAPGEAPLSETTGDPVFCRMWSLLHTPAINLPVARGPNDLPLGVQVIGRIGEDAQALACAHWLEQHFRWEYV